MHVIPPVLLLLTLLSGSPAAALDVDAIVRAGFDYWRGQSSASVVEMTIHRPRWERSMTIRAWTRGQDQSIFWIIAPPRENGTGTLKKKRQMWIYNPRINRTIKIPPSMMSQSWMGSDFSNNDLVKSDSLLHDYTHVLIGTGTHQGRRVYHIRSLPKAGAPVVWGCQELKIREDYILLEQIFFDEEFKPVKVLAAEEIQMLGGRLFPRVWKMQQVEKPAEYTRLEYLELAFDVDLPERLFTLSALKTPPR